MYETIEKQKKGSLADFTGLSNLKYAEWVGFFSPVERTLHPQRPYSWFSWICSDVIVKLLPPQNAGEFVARQRVE